MSKAWIAAINLPVARNCAALMTDDRPILDYSTRRPPPRTTLSAHVVMAVFVLLVFCLIVLLGVS